MVLLNASTISVVISSGIVCSFTFLLFLSGYVLQQQTVRSLQEALQAPIEERVRPKLNAARRPDEDVNDTIVRITEGNDEKVMGIDTDTGLPQIKHDNDDFVSKSSKMAEEDVRQILIAANQEEEQTDEASDSSYETKLSSKELWLQYLEADESVTDQAGAFAAAQDLDSTSPAASLHLAYILSLPHPSDICSALLFAKTFQSHHSLSSASRRKEIPIILLYPSTWETSAAAHHISAMTLLRDATHADLEHNIQLHPVSISSVWTGVSVSSQLLAELARNPWNYDRLLYLKTPGMLIDAEQLDWSLGAGTTGKTMKNDWERLKAPSRRGAGSGNLDPEVLLWAQGRGLMVPKKGKPTERLVAMGDIDIDAELETIGRGRGGKKGDMEAIKKQKIKALSQAAYVEFEGDTGSSLQDNVVFRRFDRERRMICERSGLIE